MKCVRRRKAAARRPDTHQPAINSLPCHWRRFAAAAFALLALFLEGTLSRVDAAILFTGVCKTRKMHSLRQEYLARVLQLDEASIKVKSRNFSREAEKLDELRVENRKDLRGDPWRCFAAVPSETVSASSSASAYPARQLARTPKSAAAPSPEGQAALLSFETVARRRGDSLVCQ
jgi:hypothetical protein